MLPSVLSEVLIFERGTSDRMAASIQSGARSVPILNEVPTEENVGPILVTNSSFRFVPTFRAARGVVRHAFSKVRLEDESQLLNELYMTLLSTSWKQKWMNRCNNVQDAVSKMIQNSLEPAYVILPRDGYEEPPLPGMRVLPSDLPVGCALVTAVRSLTGFYTRVGDYLGVMVLRANVAWMVVGDDVA